MHRRTLTSLVVLVGLALPVSAGAQSPSPDPQAVLGKAVDAFLAAPSFHLHGAVTSVAAPGAPGLFGSGTSSIDGDVSLPGRQAELTFDAPLVGGAGALRIASDGYIYSQLAIDPSGRWHRSTPGGSGDPSATPQPVVIDTASIATWTKAILGTPGVTATRSGQVPCPAAAEAGAAATCDVIDVTIPARLLGFGGSTSLLGASPGPSPVPVLDIALSVLVDEATVLPDTIEFEVDMPGAVKSTGAVALTGYGEPVSVSPPPASEVTTDSYPIDIFLGGSPQP